MASLEKYKKGELSIEELESFTDTFMRAKYDNDRKNRWQQKLADEHDIDRTTTRVRPKQGSQKRLLYLAYSIAAAILLLLLFRPGLSYFSSPTYDQLADQFIAQEFYANRDITKSDQDIEQLNLNAILAYNQKDFSAAILNFEAIVASGTANDEQLFFLGLSYLYNEQYTEAIEYLSQVIPLKNESKYKQEVNWFLALAYLKNEDLEKGKTALQAINQGMWNYENAQQLLQVLK